MGECMDLQILHQLYCDLFPCQNLAKEIWHGCQLHHDPMSIQMLWNEDENRQSQKNFESRHIMDESMVL